jgi:hypothetical protein
MEEQPVTVPSKERVFPIQTHNVGRREAGQLSESVYMAAYEVYCHVHGPQEAMITGGCRGGFGVGEIVAFLYARAFPKDQWRERADEAFRNMRGLT